MKNPTVDELKKKKKYHEKRVPFYDKKITKIKDEEKTIGFKIFK